MTSTYTSSDTFKLIRPKLPLRSNGAGMDDYAQAQVDSLTDIVSKNAWPSLLPDPKRTPEQKNAQSVAGCGGNGQGTSFWKDVFLSTCHDQSIAKCIKALKKSPEPKGGIDLDALLTKDQQTSLLYEVEKVLDCFDLQYNAATLLSIEPVKLFLFAHAVYVKDLSDPASIAKYMVDDDKDDGITQLYAIIAKRSIEQIAADNRINVGSAGSLWQRKGDDIIESEFSYESSSFSNNLLNVINDFAFNSQELRLVETVAANLKLNLSDNDKDFLVEYIQNSNFAIDTPELAERFLPIAISNKKNATLNFLSAGTTTNGSLDFSVRYYEETSTASEINRENVHCAAQLFYVMTLGEELGIFPAADLLITKYLATGIVDIRSPQLLQDLQNYAFNDKFVDLHSGLAYDRSQAEERRMFYRQVFNFGDSTMMEGQIVNTEFEMLWNALMVETVRYIEKIESSERPEAYVSRQNIAQPIEDLQYNLSTFSSGMGKIYSPIINRELDFVIERLFKSQEIIDQLALHNSGSFKKVLERILQDNVRTQSDQRFMPHSSVNISALFNKAMYGHKIMSTIADYTPSMIDDDSAFSELVSTIEAFIITSSQLENGQDSLWEAEQENPSTSEPSQDAIPDMGTSEWNF